MKEKVEERLKISVVCTPQRPNVSLPWIAGRAKIGSSPVNGGAAILVQEHIAPQSRMSSVSIWEGMNPYKAIVESNGGFVRREDFFPHPEPTVLDEVLDRHGNLDPVNTDRLV